MSFIYFYIIYKSDKKKGEINISFKIIKNIKLLYILLASLKYI